MRASVPLPGGGEFTVKKTAHTNIGFGPRRSWRGLKGERARAAAVKDVFNYGKYF